MVDALFIYNIKYFRLFFQSITETVAWKQLWEKRGHLYLTICPIESVTPISNINCLFTTSVILNALSNVTSPASSISKSVAVRFGLTENVVKYEKTKLMKQERPMKCQKNIFVFESFDTVKVQCWKGILYYDLKINWVRLLLNHLQSVWSWGRMTNIRQ